MTPTSTHEQRETLARTLSAWSNERPPTWETFEGWLERARGIYPGVDAAAAAALALTLLERLDSWSALSVATTVTEELCRCALAEPARSWCRRLDPARETLEALAEREGALDTGAVLPLERYALRGLHEVVRGCRENGPGELVDGFSVVDVCGDAPQFFTHLGAVLRRRAWVHDPPNARFRAEVWEQRARLRAFLGEAPPGRAPCPREGLTRWLEGLRKAGDTPGLVRGLVAGLRAAEGAWCPATRASVERLERAWVVGYCFRYDPPARMAEIRRVGPPLEAAARIARALSARPKHASRWTSAWVARVRRSGALRPAEVFRAARRELWGWARGEADPLVERVLGGA